MTAEWRAQAACVGHTELFYPAQGDREGIAAAKAICAGCAVTLDCITEAMEAGETQGVWGGVCMGAFATEDPPYVASDEPASLCGTEAGYRRHRRAHTQACEACKMAHADVSRAAYHRRSAA